MISSRAGRICLTLDRLVTVCRGRRLFFPRAGGAGVGTGVIAPSAAEWLCGIPHNHSLSDGQIHAVEAEQPRTRGRRGKRRTIMSAGAVKKLRPERDEIIVCTALNLKASGIQYWGSSATGFLAARHAR